MCPVLSGLWTFGKGIGIQVLEYDGWKRTGVGVHPIIDIPKGIQVVERDGGM